MEQLLFYTGLAIIIIATVQLFWFMVRTGQRWSRMRKYLADNEQNWDTSFQAAKLQLKKVTVKDKHWNGSRKFEIGKKVFENEHKTICSFYLYPHDQKPLPPFSPGQFLCIEFDIPDPDSPRETIKEQRCYSLSDSPNSEYYRISVRCVSAPQDNPDDFPPGLVSNYLHQDMQEGDLVDIHAPSGDFFLDTARATPICLIGGGIGLTPVLSMCKTLADEKSDREVWVIYGMRDAHDIALELEFIESLKSLENLNLLLCYSSEMPNRPRDPDPRVQRISGRADIHLLKSILPHHKYEYYFCGPGPMMTSLHKELLAWEVPEKDIHYEFFAPEESAPPAISQVGDQSFDVEFTLSNKKLTWSGDNTLYALTRRNNFKSKNIKYACKQGKCGSCMSAIKNGTVGYRDKQPSYPGLLQGFCLPCICIPTSNLEIEA
jgi:hypothetical protein